MPSGRSGQPLRQLKTALFQARHPREFSQYKNDLKRWLSMGGLVDNLLPAVMDFNEPAGEVGGAYFHQDLLVAQEIFERGPSRHIDIGSRIDGFIAHLAVFRRVEYWDIRELDVPGIPEIHFRRIDIMNFEGADEADSVSCLHSLEHFGLGRYGDPIDPEGHIRGLRNLEQLVCPGGNLFLSVPVANQSRVDFNSHRVFAPESFLELVSPNFSLEAFHLIDDNGALHRNHDLFLGSISVDYGCGVFIFKKEF